MVHGCITLATRTMHTFKKKKGTQDWHQKLGRCWDGRDTSSHLLVLCMGLWWVSKRQSGPKCHAFVPPFLGWWVCDWRLSFLSGGPSQRDSECPRHCTPGPACLRTQQISGGRERHGRKAAQRLSQRTQRLGVLGATSSILLPQTGSCSGSCPSMAHASALSPGSPASLPQAESHGGCPLAMPHTSVGQSATAPVQSGRIRPCASR